MTLPVLVFLHGFLGTGAQWNPVRRALAKWPTLAPDLPGHGRTPLPPHTLHFDWLSAWLDAWLDTQQVSKAVLIGYSMGGRLAWHFAVHHPGRLVGLAIEGAAPGICDALARDQRRAADAARAARIHQVGLRTFAEEWYRQPLFHSLAEQPVLLSRAVQSASRQDAKAMARVIAELSPGRQPPLWDALPTLDIPTLLIAGARDAKYAALLDKAAALMPRAQRINIPGAGHNAHLEQSAAFAEAVRAWLEREQIMRPCD